MSADYLGMTVLHVNGFETRKPLSTEVKISLLATINARERRVSVASSVSTDLQDVIKSVASYFDGVELSFHFKIYFESARTKKEILIQVQHIERNRKRQDVVFNCSGYSYSKTAGHLEILFLREHERGKEAIAMIPNLSNTFKIKRQPKGVCVPTKQPLRDFINFACFFSFHYRKEAASLNRRRQKGGEVNNPPALACWRPKRALLPGRTSWHIFSN